jgi:hypothetical protein
MAGVLAALVYPLTQTHWGQQGPWASALLGIGAILALVGLGRWVTRCLLQTEMPRDVTLRMSYALGAGTLAAGYLLSVLAWAGWLTSLMVGAVMLVGWGGLAAQSRVSVTLSVWKNGLAPRTVGLGRCILMGMLGLWMLAATVPSFYYDALVYHYAVPSIFLAHGGFIPLPGMIYANFPYLMDLVNVLGLAFDPTGVAANLLNLAFAFAVLPPFADMARTWFGPTSAWFAVLLFVTCPVMGMIALMPSNDMPVNAFAVLSAHALLHYAKTHRVRWLIMCGVFSGAALFTKNASVIIVLIPLAAILTVIEWRRAGFRGALRWAWGLALPVALASPTFIKNAVLTGNPFMPALYTVLGGRHWSALEHVAFLGDVGSQPLGVETLLGIPAQIFNVILVPAPILSREYMGPLMLMGLASALVLVRRRRPKMAVLGGAILLQLLIWCVTFPHRRFLGTSVMMLSVIGGAGLRHLMTRARGGWRTVVMVALSVGLWISTSSWYAGIGIWQPDWAAVALGLVDRGAYIQTHADYAQAGDAAREALGPGEYVLMFGEGRSYHLDAPVIPTSAVNVSPLTQMLRQSAPSQEMTRQLKALGVGAILLRPSELGRLAAQYATWRLSEDERSRLMAFLQQETRLVFKSTDSRTLLFDLAPE